MTTGFYGQTEPNYAVIRARLILETADYRWFVDPYGPHHAGALAKLHLANDSHVYTTFIDRVELQLGENEYLPVEFAKRTVDYIEVRVDFTGSRLWDREKRDGLVLKLYPWTEPHRR